MGCEEGQYSPLFETKQAKGRLIHRIFACYTLLGICMTWFYRASSIAQILEVGGERRLVEFCGLICLFCAEIWYAFYCILTQSVRWNPVYRYTFKDRLLMRYKKHEMPKVDIFVCTADPVIEPPIMVVNTVLSVMAYNYPPEKLSVYLSDDGGSILTFYALFEASIFSKTWLPYCRKYNIEPTSPSAYFASLPKPNDDAHANDLASIMKLYEEMRHKIETSTELHMIPQEIRSQHKGFSAWDEHYNSKHDHDTILQILIDGRNPEAKDVDKYGLPTLVYLGREKRPQYFHNYKAGAMNALLRVSSEISNGVIIMNVDCDMYSNNSRSILDALCFFMDDQKRSHRIAFVQFPQRFLNITSNDIYGSSLRIICEVEAPSLDGLGGPCYIGSGCFLRRDVLYGKNYSKDCDFDWKMQHENLKVGENVNDLERRAKKLASCTYETNSQWGKQVGLKYECAAEDIVTGLSIHCRGWKSVYLNPKRSSFLGLAPSTLIDALVQHQRWSEGQLQIMLNHNPMWHGHGRISLGHQLSYCHFNFWALNSLPTLLYCTLPSLYMLQGISLFPKVSSPWFLPFGYIVVAKYMYSLGEFLCSGGTIQEWWNVQRMWLYKRTSSYLFALMDTILKVLGLSTMKFVITTKVVDEDVARRYEKEIMEFGVDSPMFTILTCISLVNLFTSIVTLTRLTLAEVGERRKMFETLGLQLLLSMALVLINLPLFNAIFLRKDKGKMPRSVTIKATFIAISACTLFMSSGV